MVATAVPNNPSAVVSVMPAVIMQASFRAHLKPRPIKANAFFSTESRKEQCWPARVDLTASQDIYNITEQEQSSAGLPGLT